jgi:hypothetical protein
MCKPPATSKILQARNKVITKNGNNTNNSVNNKKLHVGMEWTRIVCGRNRWPR